MRLLRLARALLRIGFSEAVAYRSELLVWLLTTNTPLIMLLLWTAVAAEAPVGRYGEKEFVAYFLTTLVVRLLTGGWVVWQINMEARSGELSMRLLRPMHPFLAYALETLAAWPLRFAMCLPIILTAVFWVGAEGYSQDALHWAVAPVSLIGAWALTFGVMLCIGTLALYWHSSVGIFEIWLGLYFIFSGYIVPLDLFPPEVQAVLVWLPFRYLISFPVETALGVRDAGAMLLDLGRQWTFVALAWGAALLLWHRGARRYEAFGG